MHSPAILWYIQIIMELCVVCYSITGRQRDIAGNTCLQTQLIYLTTHNIILTTKERFMNNTITIKTMLSLMLNLSHH